MMQLYTGPILTLEHARLAGRRLQGECRRCGWLKFFAVWTIECLVRDKSLTIAQVGNRMRCRCGNVGVDLAHTQHALEVWSDAIALAEHIREQHRIWEIETYTRETRALERSWRAAGWLDRER